MPPALSVPKNPVVPSGKTSYFQRLMPGLHAAFANGWTGFRADGIAAITLAAYLLPSNIGDATLAGLPPEAGLYSCLFSGLVFWIFCSSRHTAVTVTSAISLLVGSSLGEFAGGDPARFWALASCTALLVGTISLIAWIVRAGVLVNFISETVLIGFKAGVGLYLSSTQLPKLFGFKGSHGDFWERMAYFFTHLHETHPLSLAMGAIALVIILAGKVFLKNKPVALFVMIAGIIFSSLAHLEKSGVSMLGEIPHGLPNLRLPMVHWEDLNSLLPLSVACFLLSAVETAAVGRMFALKHGYRIDNNQELLAIAAANLATGIGRGYPVGGGMSQSLVNESAGARTSLSGFLAACLILLVTVFLSGLLRDLPQPVLAAIVLAAVTGLFKVSALQRLWHFSRSEFAVAIAALIGVLCSSLLNGVLIGALLSVLMLLRRASRPHTTELGRVPGSNYFADALRHEENARIPGVFVFRADSSLLYFNIEHIRDRFLGLLNQRSDNVHLAIFFVGLVPFIDAAGVELLEELSRTMKSRGIRFRLAEAHGDVRDALRRGGFEAHHGPIEANKTIAEILAEAPASS